MRNFSRLLGLAALFLVTTGQASTDGCVPAPETAPEQEPTTAAPSASSGDAGQTAGAGNAASPPLGRYTCLRMGSVVGSDGMVENQIAPDIRLMPGGRYSNLEPTGTYSYDAGSRTITWLSGSLATSKTNWVGIFVPPGPDAKDPTILIRDEKDIAAGNKRDLQWCNHAE